MMLFSPQELSKYASLELYSGSTPNWFYLLFAKKIAFNLVFHFIIYKYKNTNGSPNDKTYEALTNFSLIF